jgi:hypothetical protein
LASIGQMYRHPRIASSTITFRILGEDRGEGRRAEDQRRGEVFRMAMGRADWLAQVLWVAAIGLERE